jgi:hypothetical protein
MLAYCVGKICAVNGYGLLSYLLGVCLISVYDKLLKTPTIISNNPVFSSVASPAVQYFSVLSHKRHDSKKECY